MLSDPQLEMAVLGGILWRNEQYDVAAAILRPSDFSLTSHEEMFAVCGRLIREGCQVDAVMLASEGRSLGRLEAWGGTSYIVGLTERILPKTGVETYARQVLEFSQLRRVARLGEELALPAVEGDKTASEVIEDARARLEAILGDSAAEKTAVRDFSVAALDRWKRERASGEDSGMYYGIRTLDEKTGGMFPGENTTVGGDPGHGKSSFAIQAILENCPKGTPTFFVSLEMTRDQVLRRLWSNKSNVGPWKMRHARHASEVDARYVQDAALEIAEWPLHIYDKSTVRLEQLSGMLRLAIRKFKVRLFIVDFVQILSVGGRDMRERVSKASDSLTAIAKGEGVHLMLLSQLSRRSHAEMNRPPRMSDLRESGSLEQNAHCVVLIHRPWDETSGMVSVTPARNGQPGCELIIAKQREGATCAFPVRFNSSNLTFEG